MRKLFLSICAFLIVEFAASQPFCLYNLQYRQPITINNTLGTLSNFQVKITMNTSSLVSAGKMKSTGDDIRFTDGNCVNIPYFIESGMNTSSTVIWLKPTTLVNGNNSIYMYYSDPTNAYSAASNATAVFDFVDDFNGSSLSAAWTTEISAGTITVASGAANFSNTNNALAISNATYNYPIWTEAKFNSASGNWPTIMQFANGAGQINPTLGGTTMYPGYYTASFAGRGCNFYTSLTAGTLAGTWGVAWNATNDGKMFWPGGSYTYTSTPTKPTSVQIAIGNLASGTASSQVDWVRVRKYASTDPTASFGTEVVNYNLDMGSLRDPNTGNVKSSFCGGELFNIASALWLQLGSSGQLIVELSDASGSFSSPTTVYTFSLGTYSNTITSTASVIAGSFTMPNNLPYGTGYRARWRTVDRAYTGAPTGVLTIGAMPTSTNFTIDNAAQCNETDVFTFTASGSLASGNTLSRDWNFGDTTSGTGSPISKSYAWPGTKTVSFKAYNASLPRCSADVVRSVVVHPQPVAYIDHSDQCQNNESWFYGWGSYIAYGSINSFAWDYGDGNTSSDYYYTFHKYNTFGKYTVSLVVTSDKGCKDTQTVTHNVWPKPVVNFTTGLACDGDKVAFKDLSTVNSFGNSNLVNGYASQYYKFGDGGESYDRNTEHLYNSAGTYSVYHQVNTNYGCWDTIRKNVVVNPSPIAKFSATNTCLTSNLVLTNQSTITAGTLTYKWDLGNGTTNNTTSPSVLYSQSGTYNVKLVATAGTGCTDSTDKNITIYSMPVANFSATNECQGTANEFTDYSTEAASYLWTFESGQTSTDQNPTYTYASAGSRNVALEVTTSNGCKNTITKTVEVWPNPIASYNQSSASSCFDQHNYTFTNTSSVSSGGIVSHNWTFGDNTVSQVPSPNKKYASEGTYAVSLTVVTDKGCSSAANSSVTVDPTPKIDFSFNNSCEKTAVQFLNNSTVSSGGSFGAFSWNFGDATNSAVANPSHTYASSGNYSVTLEGTTNKGCKSTSTKTYTAWPNPVVSFSNTDACLGVENNFTNTSGVSSGFMASYDWTFGDGGTSKEINPSHLYGSAGAYSISLKGTTDKGCFANANGTANVWPKPVANFSVANVCQGLTSVFNNLSTLSGGMITSNSWSFGDGAFGTAQNPTHNYAGPGRYIVSLTVNSDKNCQSSISKETEVYKQPIAQIYATPTKTSVLEPLVTFSDNSLFSDYSAWDFVFGSRTSTNNTDTCTYTKPGNYNVRLVASTAQGCTDTANVVISVENGYTMYFPNAFTPNADELNDAFGAVGIFEGVTTYALNVLDNRGRVLFSTTDVNEKWNGKLENTGEELPAGNYAWFVEYTDFKGVKHSENGIVSIRK